MSHFRIEVSKGIYHEFTVSRQFSVNGTHWVQIDSYETNHLTSTPWGLGSWAKRVPEIFALDK